MHTSAKARLTRIAIRIRILIQIGDLDRHQNLIISLAHCQPSMKISFVRKFLRKVANRQTDGRTNNEDCISSLLVELNSQSKSVRAKKKRRP